MVGYFHVWRGRLVMELVACTEVFLLLLNSVPNQLTHPSCGAKL